MTKHKIQNKFECQISNYKTLVLVFVIVILNLFCALNFVICHLCAQEDNKLVALSKQIIEANTNEELYAPFEELKDLYFKENRYSELIDFLGSLTQKKETLAPFVNYYTALSRYYQLKHLEEMQNWDEYFNNGNTYRDQLSQAAQKAISSTNIKEPLNVYAQLLLWQFHKDQADAFVESSLSDLLNAVSEYSQDTLNPEPIKEVADKLSNYGEEGKARELYHIYVEKLIASVKEDKELEKIASGFYNEGNLDLSEALYNAYLERVSKTLPKEESLPILVDIAKKFSYKDEGTKDPYYAEKIFAKIEEIGSQSVFNEELIYLRAFNSEKMKEYLKTRDFYIDLVRRYPETTHVDEANFKVGIISTYVFRDIKTGRDYLEKLAQKENSSLQGILSLYHLGLLSQWEGDSAKAKAYYNKLIEKVKDAFDNTVTLAKERLKEIGEVKPLEYNLKAFLDTSLKEEYSMFDMTKLDLKASLYRPKKDQQINISAYPHIAESGCMHVEMQYLWSGDLGTAKPSLQQQTFDTTYTQPGIKVINLVVVSPTGIIDRNIDIVDVY